MNDESLCGFLDMEDVKVLLNIFRLTSYLDFIFLASWILLKILERKRSHLNIFYSLKVFRTSSNSS